MESEQVEAMGKLGSDRTETELIRERSRGQMQGKRRDTMRGAGPLHERGGEGSPGLSANHMDFLQSIPISLRQFEGSLCLLLANPE